ncbi:hypothetical protein [Streptomyces sp. NPDC050504]|uniref:DUF7507 domain-containing protein n=1 Tax=Streptomyces sp. NPDC050504 TaxID=3365618 RepID=UPI0037B66BA5
MALAGVTAPAHAAEGKGSGGANGSLILGDSFTGTSIADPHLLPLGDACLTAAVDAPPPGSSALGPCARTENAPAPGAAPGYLQLTDASKHRSGAVVYDLPLPGNGGLSVEFEQYQYGGNGADGIGFFLVDGSRTLKRTGGTGGSLGYAPLEDVLGVDGGYVGVGLDTWGNYVKDTEGRGEGCAKPSPHAEKIPNAVSLRGPGDGGKGYCLLRTTADEAGKSTLPGQLRGTSLKDAKRTVKVVISAEKRPVVTVSLDFHDGSGYREILKQRMSKDAPKTYKFGFAGSTGGWTDTHLIRNLEVWSLEPLGELNLVKQVDQSHGVQPDRYRVGDTVPYQFIVTNTSPFTISALKVDDPKIKDVSCPVTVLKPKGEVGASAVCTGEYTVTRADAEAGRVVNTARAKGDGSQGAEMVSNESTAEVLTEEPEPEPEPEPTDDPSEEPGPGPTDTPSPGPTGDPAPGASEEPSPAPSAGASDGPSGGAPSDDGDDGGGALASTGAQVTLLFGLAAVLFGLGLLLRRSFRGRN